MPKRRRLFTPLKNRNKQILTKNDYDEKVEEVSTARGRLQGALLEVLNPTAEDSDESRDQSPEKEDQYNNVRYYNTEEEEDERPSKQPPKQSYVLKLFDRSVDLSQFNEDTPLYPICRAWIANQPKVDYSQFSRKYDHQEVNENSIELPGPEGPPVSKVPELLQEQKASSKLNINLNYRECVLPTKEQLLRSHEARWAAVRASWLEQSNKAEARYEATQKILNKINVNSL